MLAENIKEPEDYLNYSHQILQKCGVLTNYPKIRTYYYELCNQFKRNFHDKDSELFLKWRNLLAIDAQIQILLELTEVTKLNWIKEFEMSEDKIIQMIKRDKDYFYRELTGGNTKQKPKWGLIYLSEKE